MMNELPQPSMPIGDSAVSAQPITASASQAQPPQQVDEKLLQERAIEQIEGIVLNTAANPSQRADEIHAIKDAYLKVRFGIELKEKSPHA